MSKELNCMNCCIGDFKDSLCDCDNGFCKEFKSIGDEKDFINAVVQRMRSQAEPTVLPVGVIKEYDNGMVAMRRETYQEYHAIAVNEAVRRLDIDDAPTIDTSEGCKGCKHWIYRSNFGEDCEFDDLENCKYEPKDGR